MYTAQCVVTDSLLGLVRHSIQSVLHSLRKKSQGSATKSANQFVEDCPGTGLSPQLPTLIGARPGFQRIPPDEKLPVAVHYVELSQFCASLLRGDPEAVDLISSCLIVGRAATHSPELQSWATMQRVCGSGNTSRVMQGSRCWGELLDVWGTENCTLFTKAYLNSSLVRE